MKKYMFSLMMVFLMVAGMCIPASATEILPKPLENIPAKMEKANIDFRMDTPVKLFTMKCQNLMLGEIVTTFDNFQNEFIRQTSPMESQHFLQYGHRYNCWRSKSWTVSGG